MIEQSGAPLGRAEKGRPLERRRGGTVGPPLAGTPARTLERGRRRVVAAERGRREVPGPLVGIAIGERRSERAMRLAPLRGRHAGVRHAAQQRVAKLQRGPAQAHEIGLLGLLERGGGEAAASAGRDDRREVAGRARRRQRERAPRLMRAGLEPTTEGSGDPRGHVDRSAGHEWLDGRTGELEQRERVSTCGRVQPLRLAPRSATGTAEQLRGRSEVETAERDRRQPALVERGRLAIAGREQRRDRVGDEAARSEHERIGGGGIEPVAVVDEQAERLLIGRRREQAEGGGADDEAVAGRDRPERERARERARLPCRNVPEPAEHRLQQRVQAGKRHLALGLHAPRAQHPHGADAGGKVVEQRGLAAARLAAQDHHAARAQASRGEHRLEGCDLARPAEERGHAASVSGT